MRGPLVLAAAVAVARADWRWVELNTTFGRALSFEPSDAAAPAGAAAAAPAPFAAPPETVLSVFGAEGSGTKLVARALAHAARVAPHGAWRGDVLVRDARVEVHHLSLPWGGSCDAAANPPTLDAWVKVSQQWPP